MIDPLTFLLIALAAWRLAYLLVYDTGPFEVFATLRFYLGAAPLNCQEQINTGVTNPLCCMNCISIYTAAASIALWIYVPVILWVLAASGGVMLVSRFYLKTLRS